jgi:hypothetical protein
LALHFRDTSDREIDGARVNKNGMCVSWSGQHQYEPRYDESPNVQGAEVLKASFAAGQLGRWRLEPLKIYVCDVCRHCGDVIDRLDKGETT